MSLKNKLVLELFPGAGLFGRAFSHFGACVVNAGDLLHGYDIKDFKGVEGKFDIVIGSPPCQPFSQALPKGQATPQEDLIPEFLRVVEECSPKYAVIENVFVPDEFAPSWPSCLLKDYDCGGLTSRLRYFWFNGIAPPPPPPRKGGKPHVSVLASSWKNRGKGSTTPKISPEMAAHLQGFPGLHEKIIKKHPGGWVKTIEKYDGVTTTSRKIIATHLLGNGVPFSLGVYVASYLDLVLSGKSSPVFQEILDNVKKDSKTPDKAA